MRKRKKEEKCGTPVLGGIQDSSCSLSFGACSLSTARGFVGPMASASDLSDFARQFFHYFRGKGFAVDNQRSSPRDAEVHEERWSGISLHCQIAGIIWCRKPVRPKVIICNGFSEGPAMTPDERERLNTVCSQIQKQQLQTIRGASPRPERTRDEETTAIPRGQRERRVEKACGRSRRKLSARLRPGHRKSRNQYS